MSFDFLEMANFQEPGASSSANDGEYESHGSNSLTEQLAEIIDYLRRQPRDTALSMDQVSRDTNVVRAIYPELIELPCGLLYVCI